MPENSVEQLYRNIGCISEILNREQEESLRLVIDEYLGKALLVAAASHFEARMAQEVARLVEEIVGSNHLLLHLINARVIRRQYHTWFDWKATNANHFFQMFGKEFSQYAIAQVRSDEELSDAIVDFIDIGRTRNLLVHEDFGNYVMDKTHDDVYRLYRSANKFVDWFPETIRAFIQEFSESK